MCTHIDDRFCMTEFLFLQARDQATKCSLSQGHGKWDRGEFRMDSGFLLGQ